MNTPHPDVYCGGAPCAGEIGQAISAVSGRWAVEVIEGLHFAGGTSRYRALLRRIDGISSKQLSSQLRVLTDSGIIAQVSDSSHISAYQLTERGRTFMRHLQSLGEWVRARHAVDGPPDHRVSGQSADLPAASWLDPLRPSARPMPGSRAISRGR